MGFFPPISVGAPTFKDSPQDPMPWEQGFGKTAITDVVLAEDSEGAVLLRSVIAYPSVMTLDVTAQLRQPLLDGPGTRGHDSPSLFARTSDSPSTGLVLFGLLFSDGSKLLNVGRDNGHVTMQSPRGGSGAYQGQQTFVVPLPPEGRVEAWVAWPAASIPETLTILDADVIRRASEMARGLWE
jgi:hypothetical protein